jgi:hypothetical protein
VIQLDYITRLIKEYDIRHFVETGTYEGQTSLYFHNQGMKVHTAESESKYFYDNSKRFQYTDIESFHGDSRDFLKDYVKRGLDDSIYYLDAHWVEPLPLSDEISILMKLKKFVIVVHDVGVDGKPQFTFDNNVHLTWAKYVEENGLHSVLVICPDYTIVNCYPPYNLCGYCILIRGYPMIFDGNFLFIEASKQ